MTSGYLFLSTGAYFGDPDPASTPSTKVAGILCKRCNKLSLNRGDIVNRYCSSCKVFHNERTETVQGREKVVVKIVAAEIDIEKTFYTNPGNRQIWVGSPGHDLKGRAIETSVGVLILLPGVTFEAIKRDDLSSGIGFVDDPPSSPH